MKENIEYLRICPFVEMNVSKLITYLFGIILNITISDPIKKSELRRERERCAWADI